MAFPTIGSLSRNTPFSLLYQLYHFDIVDQNTLYMKQAAHKALLFSCLAYSSTLKMKAKCASEMTVEFQTTYKELHPRR
jgi:hypothetical protein